MIRSSALGLALLLGPASYAVLSVNITKYNDAPCGQALGAMEAGASGGVPPYSYSWSNGAMTEYIDFLPMGTYTVTVTDANSDVVMASEDILFTSAHTPYPVPVWDLANCPGEDPYCLIYLDDPHHGPMPHMISGPNITNAGYFNDGTFNYHYIWSSDAPGSAVTMNWTDGAGCPGSSWVTLSTPLVWPTLNSLTSTPACNGNNGSVSFNFQTYGSNTVAFHLRHGDGSDVVGSGLYSTSWGGPYGATWTWLAPGPYWVHVDPDGYDAVPAIPGQPMACADSFYVEVLDLSGTCGQVSGTAYFDHDQDCVQDAGDHGIGGRIVTFAPGAYAITNGNGTYSRYLANGTYSTELDGTGTDFYPICPSTSPVSVVVSGGSVTQDFADSSLLDLDLEARINAGPARPGFIQNVWLQARNLSGRVSGDLDIVLQIDPALSFVSADVAPTSVVGNTVTWAALAALSSFQWSNIHVQLQVPPDPLLIGQSYTHTAMVSQAITESSLTNNADDYTSIITGSFDPNEKLVRTSTGASSSSYYIGSDEWIEYTIGFQNTGTDTAFTVVLRDTLSDALDLSTFEQGIASHPFTVTFLPNNVVRWRFDNILLPDSNVNEPGSHGQVSFRIRPLDPLLPGTVITNTADIYFDYNPPIRTNDAVLLAESSTGLAANTAAQWSLLPNPAEEAVRVLGVPVGSRYSVLSADGRELLSGIFGTDGRIDIQQLVAGSYFVQVADASGTQVLRFVKR